MRGSALKNRRYTSINVKIPEFLADIIDNNLQQGGALNKTGFTGRAHFAELAVAEKLERLNLLSNNDITEMENRRKKTKHGIKNSLQKK